MGVIASLGGSGAIVLLLSGWLGRVWAEHLMENERHEHALALEKDHAWQASGWRSRIGEQTQSSVFYGHFQNPNFSQGGNMLRRLAIAVFLLVFAAGLMVVGQTAPAAQEHGAMGGSPMGPMTPEARLKMLTEKLNLTEDQQAKLKPILEDQSKQMKALHEDTSLAPADKQAKMKDIHESSIEKMNAILTPDQQTKWKQMRQEMMQKHNEMKGQGQMDHQ